MNKKIYLSDINDSAFFDRIVGNYTVFDKDQILLQFKHLINNDKSVERYIANVEIEKSLSKLLRDKKVHNIVYLTYTSMPLSIMTSINDIIIPKLQRKCEVEYFIITDTVDAKDNNYDKLNKLFSDIYIRE